MAWLPVKGPEGVYIPFTGKQGALPLHFLKTNFYGQQAEYGRQKSPVEMHSMNEGQKATGVPLGIGSVSCRRQIKQKARPR